MSESAGDGYQVCPRCGHHTSAYCGGCTVLVPFDNGGDDWGASYCGCDCVVAMGGKSLAEVIAEAARDWGGAA